MYIVVAVCCGYLLDLLIGDPLWLPHPVRFIGWMISRMESLLRAIFPKTENGELAGGAALAFCVPALSFAAVSLLLWGAARIHPGLAFGLECWMCFQVLAVKSLRVESMKVYRALKAGDLPAARKAVSMIVGRDTENLDETGVTKAAVETVAENAGDGVVAPLLFLILGGGPLGLCYKAVSTLDSMVGYQNEKYRWFGRASARLDDLANFIPARLCGLLLAAAAPFCGLDGKGALRIFLRDRKKHPSPNAAHPEAACAGALGIALGGDACYGGALHHKETLGDPLRPVQPEDIVRANRLMTAASFLALGLFLTLRIFVWGVINI